MMHKLRWWSGVLLLTGLTGCGSVHLEPKAELPPPLIEKLPVTVAVCYPDEFRQFDYKEERYGVKYDFLLGPAHVTKLQGLLEAMFTRVVEVSDPAEAHRIAPDVLMVLEPRFEDYAFLTPQDMAGDYFTVTIRYRLDLYNPEGERVDGYVFTGFGRQKTGTFNGTTEPLAKATQRAMRDAGAKLAVEFTSQATVRRLLAGEGVHPKPVRSDDVRQALGAFGSTGEKAQEGGVAEPGEAPEDPAPPPAPEDEPPGPSSSEDQQPPAEQSPPGSGTAPVVSSPPG